MGDHYETVARHSTASTLTDVAQWTALSLLLATVGTGLNERANVAERTLHHAATHGAPEELLHISARDVVRAITALHEGLLARVHELDPKGREVLYANLRDLYEA